MFKIYKLAAESFQDHKKLLVIDKKFITRLKKKLSNFAKNAEFL